MYNYYKSTSDKVLMGIIYVLLGFLVVVLLYPLIYVVSSSFSSQQAVASGRVWLYPVDPSLKGYEAVFENQQVWTGYLNSLIITVSGTILAVGFTIMMAYPLSKQRFALKKPITVMLTIIMFFGGGLIPNYILIKDLHMIDTLWAVIVPSAVQVWYIIMMRTYIQSSIPTSLSEAATLDGCSDVGYLVKVVVPLSKPIIAVITLYVAVALWNSYFNAMIYLRSQSRYPLQLVLRNILILNQFDTELFNKLSDKEIMERQNLQALLKFSLIVVASVPVMILYPFIQKYFVKGIMIGSIKG